MLDGRDTFVAMPTGSGKSAVYQVPALLLDGPTAVVSPLFALQRDGELVRLEGAGSREACGRRDTCAAGSAAGNLLAPAS